MYLFFLVFFMLVSIFLISFILLQPGKGFNHSTYLSSKNNLTLFGNMHRNNLITKIISILSCLFLVISVILCNINNSKIKKNFFWEKDKNSIISNHKTSHIKKNKTFH
ncbi:preprotein translocase subunit SecG [Buchnera aphidicola]|uniref:preprotein translocase subunit SecG n=1 Tax=Buchnera aphidicola TaxID=9 RepID=UPI003BEF178E